MLCEVWLARDLNSRPPSYKQCITHSASRRLKLLNRKQY